MQQASRNQDLLHSSQDFGTVDSILSQSKVELCMHMNKNMSYHLLSGFPLNSRFRDSAILSKQMDEKEIYSIILEAYARQA